MPEDAERVTSLPFWPLHDEQLTDFLETESVVEVWVPESRPDRPDGDKGDIIDFLLEFEDRYVPFFYTSPPDVDDIAWYRFSPITKERGESETKPETLDDYLPLSDRL